MHLRRRRNGIGLCAIVGLTLLPLFCASPVVADVKQADLDGTWSVASVELAGQPVAGLAGAELTMRGGMKTFRLPSGAVEKGTYTLDASAMPRRIDSTTEGRAGTEPGIYDVMPPAPAESTASSPSDTSAAK